MTWTFGQRIAAGFAASLCLTVALGIFGVTTLQRVVGDYDRLLDGHAATLGATGRLNTGAAEAMAFGRGYLLSGGEERLTRRKAAHDAFDAAMDEIAGRGTAEDRPALAALAAASRTYWLRADALIAERRRGAPIATVADRFDREVSPAAIALRAQIDALSDRLTRRMEATRAEVAARTQQAIGLMLALVALAIVLGATIAAWLSRLLARQIGEAMAHLQASSAELQAAASQQAAGSGEQAAAMTEVSTTMRELLATARQIAGSAQRVSAIADDTAATASQGDQAVARATQAIQGIQRQVGGIVDHMGDLGRRTQQIGGVLDIIKELADQTNILSINATIEAAGAGEHGRRFAAVAEEVRRLADRVAEAAAEVRGLIAEVRQAANTTLLATEEGSKAVDAGTRQFGELATSFHQIVGLVATTAEAAREIELSTKQQTSAVEQVDLAVADAAQAARETEASSRQTLETSSQLATVARELGTLARAPGRG